MYCGWEEIVIMLNIGSGESHNMQRAFVSLFICYQLFSRYGSPSQYTTCSGNVFTGIFRCLFTKA